MTQPPIVFLDTETTHLNPRLRRPWEIGMIRRPALTNTFSSDRLTIFIEDVDLADADPQSLKIGRFDERHPNRTGFTVDDPWAVPAPGTIGLPGIPVAPNTVLMSEREASLVVEHWTRGAHIVGLVPDFDAATLDAMLRRHGHLPSWHYHLIDVETLAVGWLRGRGHTGHLLPWKSETISLACGIEPPDEHERHTAMGDALWCERWWDQITETSTIGADA